MGFKRIFENKWSVGIYLFTLLSTSLMATGPRVSSAMFSSDLNEIVAVEKSPYVSAQHSKGGLVFEIITAALKEQDEKGALTTYPMVNMVKYYITQEKVLGSVAQHLSLAPQEQKKVMCTPVYIPIEHYYYYKPNNSKMLVWNGSIKSLKGLRYGAQEAEDTGSYLNTGINVRSARTFDLFSALKKGEIDFLKEPALSAQTIIQNSFALDQAKFATLAPDPEPDEFAVCFNTQNPRGKEMSQKFVKGLNTILKNGIYRRIVEKYEGKLDSGDAREERLRRLLKK